MKQNPQNVIPSENVGPIKGKPLQETKDSKNQEKTKIFQRNLTKIEVKIKKPEHAKVRIMIEKPKDTLI